MTPVQELLYSGGEWIRRGVVEQPTSEPTGVDRSTLVKGVDRPVRGVNCGVLPGVYREDIFPGASNKVYQMSAGQTLENKTIHGTLKTANNCTVRNVRVTGWNSGTTPTAPILDMTDSGVTAVDSVLIEDSDFTPDPAWRTPYMIHAKGGGGTIRRTVLAGLVDGMQVWNGSTLYEQCWIGDPVYANPDPLRTDGDATHADGIQFEGGANSDITLDGCAVDVWEDNPNWDNGHSLFGFLVTQNQGVPRNIKLRYSWWRGGTFPINITLVPTGVIEVVGNRIVGGQHPSFPGYHVIAPTAVQNAWTLQSNTSWQVTGSAPNDVWTQVSSSILVKQG